MSCYPPCTQTQERLISVTFGLLRQGKVHFVTALREKLLLFLKTQVKDIVHGYLNLPSDPGDEATPLSQTIKELNFDPWLTLLTHVFDCLIIHLRAVQVNTLCACACVCMCVYCVCHVTIV